MKIDMRVILEYRELLINLWSWLADNPGKKKQDSPYWRDVSWMLNWCPLCVLFFDEDECRCGENCPMVRADGGKTCYTEGSLFRKYMQYMHLDKNKSCQAAKEIMNVGIGWEPRKEDFGL